MENQIMEAPNFSDFWILTTKKGLKERMAKRFHYLPHLHKINIYNKVKALKVKPDPEQYLNIGR
jgi:hypothetical protein